MTLALALPTWLRRAARPKEASRGASLELLAGQRMAVSLAPGDGLRVVAGEVVLLRPPRWLGEALVAPAALKLKEGDGWASVERECVTLVACGASRVVRLGGQGARGGSLLVFRARGARRSR